MTFPVDRAALETRIKAVSRILAWHSGSIELADVSADGTVKVRFAGMCTTCPLRPMTLAATVRKLLLEIEGVTRVEAIGVRISEEAEERLAGVASWPALEEVNA